MEENVFYVSSWQKCSRYCCELALTFSQAFCLEDKCSFPLSAATSELSDFADFPLPRRMRLYPFSPSSCCAAAACQCKQLPAGALGGAGAAAAPLATGRSSLPRGGGCEAPAPGLFGAGPQGAVSMLGAGGLPVWISFQQPGSLPGSI